MKCFFCGSDQSSVLDKRGVNSTGEIRRRRQCLKCGNRFTTYERVGSHELFVIKRNGEKEGFDREKLQSGIKKALEKRPAMDLVDVVVNSVISKIRVKGKKEIKSIDIGRVALNELKKIDKVAYLRFASVYRQFQDPLDFKKELDHLKI